MVIDFSEGENEETRPVSQKDGTDKNHECALILAVLCPLSEVRSLGEMDGVGVS